MQDALLQYVRMGRIQLDGVARSGERAIATVALLFKFDDKAFDSVEKVEKTIVNKALDAIDGAGTPKECRKVICEFYSQHIQRMTLDIEISGVGVCRLTLSARLNDEIGKCVSKTAGKFGLQTSKRVAKRMIVALALLQDIVREGTTAAFVKSNHKQDDGSTYSRTFSVMSGRFPCSVIFTVKKGKNGEMMPYHLNPEGNYSFKIALKEYLEAVAMQGDKIKIEGQIKMPL